MKEKHSTVVETPVSATNRLICMHAVDWSVSWFCLDEYSLGLFCLGEYSLGLFCLDEYSLGCSAWMNIHLCCSAWMNIDGLFCLDEYLNLMTYSFTELTTGKPSYYDVEAW